MKMDIKTSLLEEYVNIVDTTSRQNTCFKVIKVSFVIIASLF